MPRKTDTPKPEQIILEDPPIIIKGDSSRRHSIKSSRNKTIQLRSKIRLNLTSGYDAGDPYPWVWIFPGKIKKVVAHDRNADGSAGQETGEAPVNSQGCYIKFFDK